MIDFKKPLVFGDPEITKFFKEKNEEAREEEMLKNNMCARLEKIKWLEDEIECYEDTIRDVERSIKGYQEEIKKLKSMG